MNRNLPAGPTELSEVVEVVGPPQHLDASGRPNVSPPRILASLLLPISVWDVLVEPDRENRGQGERAVAFLAVVLPSPLAVDQTGRVIVMRKNTGSVPFVWAGDAEESGPDAHLVQADDSPSHLTLG